MMSAQVIRHKGNELNLEGYLPYHFLKTYDGESKHLIPNDY